MLITVKIVGILTFSMINETSESLIAESLYFFSILNFIST